jgi:DNA polymerase (family 10)
MLEIARSIGIRTSVDFGEAAATGRLREVPGIGQATEAKIRSALEAGPHAPRGLTLARSLPLSHAIADLLGGTVAGAPRRFAELSFELAIVCSAEDPRSMLDRFALLPSIVALLERRERRAVGLTIEGVPVSVEVASPAVFGTELVRATGSAEYVAALEPLPDAPDEESLYARLRLPFCRPSYGSFPGRLPRQASSSGA